MEKVLIYLDSRENKDILDYFSQYECEVKRKNLPVGDFLVSDRVVIERKTDSDFISSIIDKRLFTQVRQMGENFEKPILIIEGNKLYGRLHPNVIRGALAAIVLDWNIPILWTNDIAETAGLIFWIAKREQIQEKRDVPLRGSKPKTSLKEQQEFLVSGLPDTSIVRARSLLKHFKTPEKVFIASEKELIKAEGIGKKIAKRIRAILSKKYK